jgi:hypothetical protein
MTAQEVLAFVRKQGVVLMSARGPVPSLAETVAGERIRGSWWVHPKSRAIFAACTRVTESGEVLVCRLVDGKVTLVHRRLWPALARLAGRLPKKRLAAVREEHTPQGRHRVIEVPFDEWVPGQVLRAAARLGEREAIDTIGEDLVNHVMMKPPLSKRSSRIRGG